MTQLISQSVSSGRARPAHRSGEEPQRVRSDSLLRGGRRVIIEHAGATYTLLLTRNDKLILTK